ncbi:MAG: choice-of-anchor D domain-containing protein, partial [Silvibacterium sp.]
GEYNFLQLAWAINWLHVPGFSEPVVNFSGPTTNTWYNSDAEVTWTVSAPAANSYPSPGTSGFAQNWDSDPGNPTSEVSPGIPESTCVGYPCVPYNAFYNGPQYANATSGCLDFTGNFCAGSIGGAQGWHTVHVRAWGNEGENAGDYTYGPLGYDTIPPVTTASLSGTLISGTTYKSAVRVTLSASDPGAPTTGSGVATTYYALNSGGNQTYTGPFTLGHTGSYTVHFHSVDKAGNVETAKTISFTTSPVLSLSPSSLAFGNEVLGTTSAGKSVTVTNITSSAVPVSLVSPSGDFAVSSNTCGSSLAGGAHCIVTVTYKPSTLGAVAGDLTITYVGVGSPDRLGLSGTGLAPLTATPAGLAFGTVTVGSTSAAQIVTLKNDNPSTALSIKFSGVGDYTVTAGGGTPCGASLAAAASCTLSVTFTPHQNGSIEGAVTVTDGLSLSPLVVALSGNGTGGATSPLSFSPTSLAYGNAVVGTNTAKAVVVKNTSASNVSISKVSASGDYSASGCVTTLLPLATCTLTVTFTPSTTGAISGAIALANGTIVSPDVLNATGVGILPLAVSPTSVNFGNVTVGNTSGSTAITLSNKTAASMSIGFIASGDFSATAGGGTPCGASLAAGASCTFVVTFSPTTTGAVTGVATVTYAGKFSPQEVKLSGTGQ